MTGFRACRIGAAALLAFLLSAGPSLAEVKLRIYLQDGALQAGTLVSETPKSFVILTQEGRVEVPKNSIMFINGKTLKQWQDRPDKLFQTEIMPSDVPDPAFVNDKSLPAVPALPAKSVVAKPAVAPKAVAASPAPKPVVAAAPAEQAKPAVQQPAPASSPATRRAERQARAREKARMAKEAAEVMAATAPKKAPATPAAKAAAPVKPETAERATSDDVAISKLTVGPGRFDRTAAGVAHRERAEGLLRQGDTGRAAQEFEIARLMEPENPRNPFALGQICLNKAMLVEARHHFSNPLLRRNADAKKSLQKIDARLKYREDHQWKLKLVTIAGSFGWLPLLVIGRLIRRRKVARTTTILADDLPLGDALASPVPPALALIDFTAASAPAETWAEETVEPAEAAAPEAPVESPAPEPLPDPIYLEEAPVEALSEPEPEPVAEVPAYEPEPEEPVPVAAAAPVIPAFIPPPDPEEILSVARTVEASLIRANQRAAEGRLEEARRAYRTALALNPSAASAHLGLGYVAFAEEKWEVALLHYRKALEIDPTSADAHYGVARVLLEINRVEDALPELRATLQLDPTYDDARETLTALSKPA